MPKTPASRPDALGEAVHVGDVVAYTAAGASNMRFGKVIGFTKQGVRLYSFTQGINPISQSSHKVPVKTEVCKQPRQIVLVRLSEKYSGVPGTLLREILPSGF